MKKTIMSFSRKLFTVILSGVLFLTCKPAFAADGQRPVIRFISSDEQSLLLNIKLDNEKGAAFTLYVKDEEGNLLYSKQINETHLNVNLRLLKDENSRSFVIGIKSNDRSITKSFIVTPVTKFVDDAIIAEK